MSTSQAGLRRAAPSSYTALWQKAADQPSYREPSPFGGCNFLSHKCFCSHKIWLTQEADAKSWSSLKHVQPKEGLKELGIRYHNPRESRHFPRGAQESERYPGLFFFVSFSLPLFCLEASLMSTIVAIPTVLPGNPE